MNELHERNSEVLKDIIINKYSLGFIDTFSGKRINTRMIYDQNRKYTDYYIKEDDSNLKNYLVYKTMEGSNPFAKNVKVGFLQDTNNIHIKIINFDNIENELSELDGKKIDLVNYKIY